MNQIEYIYSTAINNNFNINTINKIHNKIKDNLNYIDKLNDIKHCCIKHKKILPEKFAKILNNYNNIKIALNTNSNLIKQISSKTKKRNNNNLNSSNCKVYK